MEITREDLTHLADLSNFSLSDDEMDSLKNDLTNIVRYISELDKLDTEGVAPTYQASDLENVWRDDEIITQSADREALLDLTHEAKSNQIKVPKVL